MGGSYVWKSVAPVVSPFFSVCFCQCSFNGFVAVIAWRKQRVPSDDIFSATLLFIVVFIVVLCLRLAGAGNCQVVVAGLRRCIGFIAAGAPRVFV